MMNSLTFTVIRQITWPVGKGRNLPDDVSHCTILCTEVHECKQVKKKYLLKTQNTIIWKQSNISFGRIMFLNSRIWNESSTTLHLMFRVFSSTPLYRQYYRFLKTDKSEYYLNLLLLLMSVIFYRQVQVTHRCNKSASNHISPFELALPFAFSSA